MPKTTYFLYLFLIPFFVTAQGVRGKITNDKGEILPFASVLAKNSQRGTMANQEGNYELKLEKGKHEIVFQFLGHTSQSRTVEIGENFLNLSISLKEQTLTLNEVRVQHYNEDPANTIMRKAIATAAIHLKEYDEYTAKVYLKGSGRLTNIPFLMKNTLKKDGIEENISYLTETVLNLRFSQPNKIYKKVLATRSNSGDSPQAQTFLGLSLYHANFGGFVSPLSPQAFSYYKFEYLGTSTDRGYEVSRIRIKPRSRGDNVFDGTLSIVENNWSIHSLDLKGSKEGIGFRLRQVYAPIQDVFMPVTDQLHIAGGMLGFKGEYNYNISYSNYRLKINPTYHRKIEVIDEKISQQKAQKPQIVREEGKINLAKTLAENKELNRKQLKKILKETEKQEKKENPEAAAVVREDSVDYTKQYDKQALSVWDTLRSVPLTDIEIKSTIKLDSINIAQAAKIKKDSLKIHTDSFSPMHLLVGHGYDFGKKDSTLQTAKYYKFQPFRLYFSGILMQANAVEGYKVGVSPNVQYRFSAFKKLYLRSDWAWTSGSNLNGLRVLKLGLLQTDHLRHQQWRVGVSAGRDIVQFNPEAIQPILNTVLTLLGKNDIRLYQKDFIQFHAEKRFSSEFRAKFSIENANRSSLSNARKLPVWRTGFSLEENIPQNLESQQDTWKPNRATQIQMGLWWQPFVKYRIRNGEKTALWNSSPEFGFQATAGNVVRTELSVSHHISDLFKGRLNYHLVAGATLKPATYFMDYKHFNRNSAFLLSGELSQSYRLFDYYSYSTNKGYINAFLAYDFRKLILTRIPKVRMLGIQERAIANYLLTKKAAYLEVGYGLENIFRVLKVEFVSGFENGKYKNSGARIGITGRIGFSRETD